MKIKIKCIWFKANGKYYTDGEGEIEKIALDRYFTAVENTVSRLSALQIALQAAGGGHLPGLNGDLFTELALTLIPEEGAPHHFQAGSFDIP